MATMIFLVPAQENLNLSVSEDEAKKAALEEPLHMLLGLMEGDTKENEIHKENWSVGKMEYEIMKRWEKFNQAKAKEKEK
jgi:hypothetical protein